MLIFSREKGQSFVIDNNRIIVTILKVDGGRVSVGVEAPKDVQVHRREVQERIDAKEGAA